MANEFCITVPVSGPTKSSEEIQNSIVKKFRKPIWTEFIKGIIEFDLLQDNDHVAVCISGGKDSILLAKLMQEYQAHQNKSIKLSFIAMNPGFTEQNRNLLETTAKEVGIDLEIFDTKIFEVVEKIAKNYPCYMCARMRRGSLYDKAQSLGANKIALGHHFDDFIETTMINILYAGKYGTMLPKLTADNYENMELIRPLVYVEEKDIIKFTQHNSIRAMNCGCEVAAKTTSSKRAEVKQLIEQLSQGNKDVKKSIFRSSQNVNVDTVLGGQINGKKFDFLGGINN